MVSTGVFVQEHLSEIRPWMVPVASGCTAVTINWNSFPSRMVLSSVVNDRLLHSGFASLSGSSRLLTMRTTEVTFDAESAVTFSTSD